MPYSTPFCPQERGGVKKNGITAVGHITLYTPGKSSDTLVIST